MIDFLQVNSLTSFIEKYNGINDKQLLANKVKEKFCLTLDRKLYYCENFAKTALIDSLENGKPLPYIKNANDLGDYNVNYGIFDTKTDIKTKVLFLGSNPKAYNIDKLLKFLAKDNSVYLLFFVGVDKDKSISTFLCPVFDKKLLDSTVIISHWAGRNSKGVAQFYGENIGYIIKNQFIDIDEEVAHKFLDKLLSL